MSEEFNITQLMLICSDNAAKPHCVAIGGERKHGIHFHVFAIRDKRRRVPYPPQRKDAIAMKKTLPVLLAVLMMLVFASCLDRGRLNDGVTGDGITDGVQPVPRDGTNPTIPDNTDPALPYADGNALPDANYLP